MRDSKYAKIARKILEKIAVGDFPEGRLPAMPRLQEQYCVSLQTINRAVKLLEKQGAVSCKSGNVGTLIDRGRAMMLAGDKLTLDRGLPRPGRVMLRFFYSVATLAEDFKRAGELFTERYPWCEIDFVLSPIVLPESGDDFDVALLHHRDLEYCGRSGMIRNLSTVPKFFNASYPEFLRPLESRWGVVFDWTAVMGLCRKNMPELHSLAELEKWRRKLVFNVGFSSLLELFTGECSIPDVQSLRQMVRFLKKLCPGIDNAAYLWNIPDEIIYDNLEQWNAVFAYSSSFHGLFEQELPEWDMRPVPGDYSLISGNALSIGSCAKHQREAWLWINFLLSAETQRFFSKKNLIFAAHNEVFEEQKSSGRMAGIISDIASRQTKTTRLSGKSLFMLYSTIFPLLENYFSDNYSEDLLIPELLERIKEINIIDTIYQD